MRRLPLTLLVAAIAACRPTHDAASDPHRETVSVAPPFDAAALVTLDAAADAAPPRAETDTPSFVGYASDGTLVVAGQKLLFARSRSGDVARARLPDGATVQIGAEYPGGAPPGVVVKTDTNTTLLATPRLAVLYDGPGASLLTESVVAVDKDHALVFQQGDALARLVLPNDVALDAVQDLRLVVRGTRVAVTYNRETDAGTEAAGLLFDRATGARVGRGVPSGLSYGSAPVGALTDTVGFLVEGRSVSRIDLETGKVVKRGSIACGKDQIVGNPTPSPTGDLVLVTCGDDGVVLDGATLTVRRRIPSIMPGCDNGPILGGDVLKDGHTLRLEGCGGEARLDLSTGKYACGDDSGLLGAPYEMGIPAPAPNGMPMPAPTPRRAPAGRDKIPRCAKSDAYTSALGTSERYHVEQGEKIAIVFDGGSISLGDNAGSTVIAPDESEFSYTLGDKVIVKSLPEGKPLAELTLAAP